MIAFEEVTKSFFARGAETEALSRVTFSVAEGEFVAIVGTSGCGKSTTLNLTAGLLGPTAGKVLYRGEVVTRINTAVGYMTQHDTLLPWRTALANVELPLQIDGVAKQDRELRSREFLEMVGLGRFENHYPSELSGGMKQRVALARTLLYAPETLLMDEPFGALDAQTRMTLQRTFAELWTQFKMTVLFVTHDLGEAIVLADRVIVIGGMPGTVIADLPVSLPRPRDLIETQATPEYWRLYRELAGLLGIVGSRANNANGPGARDG